MANNLPPNVNPDLLNILNALAFPQSQEIYAQADGALQGVLKEPGVFHQLQLLAAHRPLPKEVRLLASLVTAREVPKKWRAKSVIPDNLKPAIREGFFAFFDEDDYQIARAQLRLLVTVARQEYPRQWQSLPQDLLQPLTSSFTYLTSHPHTPNPSHPGTPSNAGTSTNTNGALGSDAAERHRQKTILLNSLWTWNAFVKEWRGVKLPVGATLMTQFIHSLRTPMYQYLDYFMSREPVLDDWELMESARYCFKICARLAEWEFSRPKEKRVDADPSRITQLVTNSLTYLSHLQSIRLHLLSSPFYSSPTPTTIPSTPPRPASNSPPARMLKSLTKFVRAIGKTYEGLMHIDPKGFVGIEGTVGAVGWWWGEVEGAVKRGEMPKDEDETEKYPKRFLLLGLILFKNILPVLSVEHKEVFTDAFITSAFHLIVDHLLPLTEEDLDKWNDDPEEWLMGELDTGVTWSYDFRPCAERLLLSLSSAARDRNVVEPLMLQKMQEVLSTPATDLATRVKQDAVLCGAGRMSRALYQKVQLDQILGMLGPALQSTQDEDRILKARIAWLIGQWVTSDEDSARSQTVWQVLLHLLGSREEGTDVAVNISAALALKECVDLWELEIAVFEGYIGQLAEQLFKLASEAQNLVGKRAVLECLTVLIERVREKVMPFLQGIGSTIPPLWAGAAGLDGEWLFKASLVVLCSKIVMAAGSSSKHILPLLVPLIEESLTSPAKEHFEEDGLVLWQVTLQHVPDLPLDDNTGLIKLFPGLIGLLSENLDVLKNTLSLMDSYMALAGQEIMQAYGSQIIYAFAACLQNAPKDQTRNILESLEMVVRTSSPATWSSVFVSTGLAQRICHLIDDEKTSGQDLAAYDTLLARIILVDPPTFATIVTSYAATTEAKVAPAKQLELTVDAMYRAMDYAGDRKRRKVIAMAFANLLVLGEGAIYEHLEGEFASAWLDILSEMQGSEGSAEVLMTWRIDSPLLAVDLEGSEELKRRDALESTDPMYTQTLAAYIMERLQIAQGRGIAPYWEKMDGNTKGKLIQLLS